MAATQVKKELNAYLPLLSDRQQEILLEMVKNLLHIDTKEKHISIEQSNNEIEKAIKIKNEYEMNSHECMYL